MNLFIGHSFIEHFLYDRYKKYSQEWDMVPISRVSSLDGLNRCLGLISDSESKYNLLHSSFLLVCWFVFRRTSVSQDGGTNEECIYGTHDSIFQAQ
jgi:hypothetical protein